MKRAFVRSMWAVLRPMLTEGRFEKATYQAWAEGCKLGTHRLKQSWSQKRFDSLDG